MDNRTHAQKRRAEAQEALREFIASKEYIRHIDADLDRDITSDELPVVKFKTETRLKLLAKLLPDLSENKSDLNVSGNLTGIIAGLGKG